MIFKAMLMVFSALATGLSLVFMLSPILFSRIEEVLKLEFGESRGLSTVLEGRVDLVNDWVYNNNNFFGPVLAVLAALNTRNAFFL